jgi:hypothetical protein
VIILFDGSTDIRFQVLQKLKHSTKYLFADLHLREYCFRRWQKYLQASYAVQTIDVAMLLWKMRDLFYDWKVATWPRQYGQKVNFQQPSILYQSPEEWDNTSGLGPRPAYDRNNDDEEGDGYSLNTFDNSVNTKKSWFAFAFGG